MKGDVTSKAGIDVGLYSSLDRQDLFGTSRTAGLAIGNVAALHQLIQWLKVECQKYEGELKRAKDEAMLTGSITALRMAIKHFENQLAFSTDAMVCAIQDAIETMVETGVVEKSGVATIRDSLLLINRRSCTRLGSRRTTSTESSYVRSMRTSRIWSRRSVSALKASACYRRS